MLYNYEEKSFIGRIAGIAATRAECDHSGVVVARQYVCDVVDADVSLGTQVV